MSDDSDNGSWSGSSGSRSARSSSSTGSEETRAVPSMVGDHRIVRELGRGNMGVVYEAVDSLLRPVALKVLDPGASDLWVRRFFEREANLLARVRHPCVVTVHAAGQDTGTGHRFVAMELVDGETLASRLERAPGRRLPSREAARLFEKVARALARVHEADVLHRDLKPTNIMLRRPDDEPVVLDFGLAADLSGAASRLTNPGGRCGTPFFMSPEQLAGRALDERSDIFSLGATLHEAVCGPRAALVPWGQVGPVGVPPDVDPRLGAILQRCLALAPADRYRTAGALADDLARLLADPAVAPPSGPARAPERTTVFICYHPDDEPWLARLRLLLASVKDQVRVWSASDLRIGEERERVLQDHLVRARAAVLLVSQAFLACDALRAGQLPALLAGAHEHGVHILPVIVRSCLVHRVKFRYPDPNHGPHEALLTRWTPAAGGRPLSSLPTEAEVDEALLKVAERLLEIVHDDHGNAPSRSPPEPGPASTLLTAVRKLLDLVDARPVRVQLGAVLVHTAPGEGLVARDLKGRRQRFRMGDAIRLRVAAPRDGHLALLDVGSSGGVFALSPSSMIPARRVGPTTVELPGTTSPWPTLELGGPPGSEQVLAFVTDEPIADGWVEPGSSARELSDAHILRFTERLAALPPERLDVGRAEFDVME